MPRGRKTALTIQLTREERQTLMAWQRSTMITAGLARRGRIILLEGVMHSCPSDATLAVWNAHLTPVMLAMKNGLWEPPI